MCRKPHPFDLLERRYRLLRGGSRTIQLRFGSDKHAELMRQHASLYFFSNPVADGLDLVHKVVADGAPLASMAAGGAVDEFVLERPLAALADGDPVGGMEDVEEKPAAGGEVGAESL